jgi:predicted Fe-Mo cluster-binding NifX family protein
VVAEQGVSHVITGHCGPKAFRALQAAGIGVITEASGTVAEAVAAFKRGTLTVADAPNSGAHGEPL